jgi:hypothetical protein
MQVTIEIHQFDGDLLGLLTLPFNLEPGQGISRSSTDSTAAYCKFITNKGATNSRGVAIYQSNTTDEFLISIPAQ